ncbi:unnamed protein product [Lepeophtheirus salmonis]|uniref:(salmon louse) hypothetical protein n=1 Tax=Lepeophtheirus salmonis TaxID=72036 RepID=A0A7R8CD25_LEPSM|nr:unnamed protein product [Lepeophtheirus salmonis]CAF2775289.1 unnamed protein product [Lepeophtheirus salmonis]
MESHLIRNYVYLLSLSTDVSPLGLGTVPSRLIYGLDCPIAFVFRKLSAAEKKLLPKSIEKQLFNFKILHVNGSMNLHADTLSRDPLESPVPEQDITGKLMCLSISSSKSNETELREAMSGDNYLRLVVEAGRTNDW